MPLTLLQPGDSSIITRIGGNPEVRLFLKSLGFVVGTPITVVSQIDGDVICAIRDTRVAISKHMASKVFV